MRERRIALQRQVLALGECCPVKHANPVVCPLFGLRSLSPSAQRAWIEHLSIEELEYLVAYHACCQAETLRRDGG